MALPFVLGFQMVVRLNAMRFIRQQIQKGRQRALRASAAEVQREAKRIVGLKAQKELYGKSSGRSKPGQLPRRDTGNYQASIKYTVGKALAFVGPTWPKGAHAGMLKWGTKKMQPRLVPADVALQRLLPRLKESYANLF